MIDSFSGEYRFLSNFYLAGVVDDYGIVYPSNEHAFQAAKTEDFEDRERIAMLDTPGKAKRAGREVVLRPGWEMDKYLVMTGFVDQKFTAHPVLAAMLVETFPHRLIEGNTWGDRVWGVCQGAGTNWLGEILMQVRHKFVWPLP